MSTLEHISAEAKSLTPDLQNELLDFLRFLKAKALGKGFDSILMSAPSLREWESPEEEAAWEYLQEETVSEHSPKQNLKG